MNAPNAIYLENWIPAKIGDADTLGAYWSDVRRFVTYTNEQGVATARGPRIVNVKILAGPADRQRLRVHPVDVARLLRQLCSSRLLSGFEAPDVIFAGVRIQPGRRSTVIAFEDVEPRPARSRAAVGHFS